MYPPNNAPAPVQPAAPQPVYAPAPQPVAQPQFAPAPQPQYVPAPQGVQPPPAPAPQPNQPSPYGSFPAIAPGANQPVAPAPAPQPPAPIVPTGQGGAYEPIYEAIAQDLGMSVDQVRATFRDDPRQFGSVMKAAAGALNRQQTPAPAPAAAPVAPSTTPTEVPAFAFQHMARDDKGLWQPTHPQAAVYAQMQNQKEWAQQERTQKFVSDPTSILQDPSVSKMINDQVKEQVQQATASIQLEAVRQQYRDKYSPVILQKDAQGQPVQGWDGKPVLSPIGQSFDKWCKDLHGRGLAEGHELYQTAMAMAEREHPQQPQYQQQPFAPLNGYGQNGQPQTTGYMQQVPPGFQQPGYPMIANPTMTQPQQPMMHQVIRRNMAANTAQPGLAPVRGPQPIRGMPIRESLQLAIQSAGLPDGQPLETYWKSMFGG